MAAKAVGPLATGALSGLANVGVNKIFGRGQVGGFLIPNTKIGSLKHKRSKLSMQYILVDRL